MSWRGMVNLLRKGPMRWCEFSKQYYHSKFMNRLENGQYIHKRFDTRVHDQTKDQSKYKNGPDWQRGIKT